MSEEIYNQLKHKKKSLEAIPLTDLLSQERFHKLSLVFEDILLDFSKQLLDESVLRDLCHLAEVLELGQQIKALFAGKVINSTENRPALHMACRDLTNEFGWDIHPLIHSQLDKMELWVEKIHASECTDVICLGIGGSELGPRMLLEALRQYNVSNLRFHFVSNLDGHTLAQTLEACDPQTTLCLISSKTFTTSETLQNAEVLKQWFERGTTDPKKHLIAITASLQKALDWGVDPDHVLEFWNFVGGRFSIWSAVGLPVALQIGMKQFREFLKGAHELDKHFVSTPFEKNIPVILALIGIWNIHFLNAHTQAIIAYDDGLKSLPQYLQQLEMESNGKSMGNALWQSNPHTAPVLWGGVGCDGQHAYMQLLHQGTQIIPVDFWVAIEGNRLFPEHQQWLIANCLSQSKALLEGRREPAHSYQYCPGNRPSSTWLYQRLSPRVLGTLLAAYEHKVFAQGVLWGINSFDQWGVELGKKIAPTVYEALQGHPIQTDPSTQGLIDFIRSKLVK